MSANLFDAGDMQRLEREQTLTEQAPRQPLQEDRTPMEMPIAEEPEGDMMFDFMLDGILSALKERL